MRNKLLNSIGTSINNTTQNNEKYPHRFLNVLFLYKMIVTEVTRQEVLIDTIDYCIDKLNDIDLSMLDPLSSLLDIDIDEQISFLKRISSDVCFSDLIPLSNYGLYWFSIWE